MIKSVKYILPATELNMAGFQVKQALPTQNVHQLDPFLLLHHSKTNYSTLSAAKHQGVDPHPHRGFSPITFVIQGEVQHRDSRGNKQIARAGEVHWIHAGVGIIHSERPTESLLKSGGGQEIVQLWVNSPKASKMNQPYYLHLTSRNFESEYSTDQLVFNRKISGMGESPLLFYWVEGKDSGSHQYNIPSGFNVCLYLIAGKIRITGFGLIESEQLVVFEGGGCSIDIEFFADSQLLILSGEAIGEKIVHSGPYVMNTETEILEAMRDYQMGKMGILIED